ncbi:MAG: hypothetical protein M1319_02745 [Chloroflexi bacterium]|nr:hypothetical protein [Chloroflexota bacterium]
MPQPGWILVEVGTHVQAGDTLARATMPQATATVDVATKLKVPPQKAFDLLSRPVGTKMQRGEILASTKGLFRRQTCQAPIDGTLASFDRKTGFARFLGDQQEYTMVSQLPGVVASIENSKTVTLELTGTRLFGIFGVGGEQSGPLKVASRDVDITPDMLDSDCAGAILLGRSGITADAMLRAAVLGARGVIVGCVSSRDLQTFLGLTPAQLQTVHIREWRFPALPQGKMPTLTIVVTEVVGTASMPPSKFELLAGLEGEDLVISGVTRLRQGLIRPEIIHPETGEAPLETPAVNLGQGRPLVWLNTAPFLGLEGNAISAYYKPQLLPAGNTAEAAAVELADGRTVLVPLADMELGESS